MERKVVQQHSHPIGILEATQREHCIRTTIPHLAAPLDKPSSDNEANKQPKRIAQQTLLKTHSKHCFLSIRTASGNNTVEPRIFEGTYHVTVAFYGEIDVLPYQLFRLLVTIFSTKRMHQL